MRRRKYKKPERRYWRTNQQIAAPKLRLLDEDNKQIGVMDVKKALAEAQKAGLDLVEIAPKAKPPVAKIVDFGKFKYQEGKKNKGKGKKDKSAEVKEVRFSPFIGDADYDTRIAKIKEFLEDGHKIRTVVKFKGRQMGSKQFGYNLLKRILVTFEDRVVIDMQPKFIGRHLSMVMSPTKKKAVRVSKDKK